MPQDKSFDFIANIYINGTHITTENDPTDWCIGYDSTIDGNWNLGFMEYYPSTPATVGPAFENTGIPVSSGKYLTLMKEVNGNYEVNTDYKFTSISDGIIISNTKAEVNASSTPTVPQIVDIYIESAIPITDLTNTKWCINSQPTVEIEHIFNLNYTSNNSNFVGYFNLSYGNDPSISYRSNLNVYAGDPGTWINQAYRLIEITGGTDATNADLISWLEANAVQVPVVDLSGTSWTWNYSPSILAQSGNTYTFNFSSDNTNFIKMSVNALPRLQYWYDVSNNVKVYDDNYEWYNEAYRNISITDGTDVSNPNLISWLVENATYQADQSLSVDVTTLENYSQVTAGLHTLSVIAKADAYKDSASSITVNYNKLATVTNESINEDNYIFDKSINATSYDIYAINGSTEILLGTLTYQKLTTPIATISGDILTVSIVINADAFEIYVDDVLSATQLFTVGTNFNLTSLDLAVGTYSITVRCINTDAGSFYLPSDFASAGSYTVLPQLDTPVNISVTGTEATLDKVENAEQYEVYVDDVSIGTYTPTSGYTLEYMSGGAFSDTITITYSNGDTGEALQGNTYSNVISIDSITYGGANDQSYTINDVVEPPLPYILSGYTIISSYSACLVEGTKILLADSTEKNIEDITYDDELLVWDFYEGKLSSAKPYWIMQKRTTSEYKKILLSDGTELRLVGQGDNCHRLFNVTKQKMLYANECVGDEVATIHGIAKVLSCEKVQEIVNYYNIITDTHYDLFAEGVLTSCRLSNKYKIENMKYTGELLISEAEEQEYFNKLANIAKER